MEVRKVDSLAPIQFGGHVDMYTIECYHWTMKDDAIDTGYDVPDSHASDWSEQQEGVSNETQIIKELMMGIKDATDDTKEIDGILATDTDNPFMKIF